MDYFICKQNDGSYTVSKFDGNDVTAVYTVVGSKCDCIAGSKRGKCKHTMFVERWKPGFYIEQHGVILSVLPLSQELISND